MALSLSFLTGCYGWQPMALGRGSVSATRKWMWALSVILFIPAAVAGFNSRKTWLIIRQHPELTRSPYRENTELSYLITYISCVVIFAWCFVQSALLYKWWVRQWILPYGVINLALAIIVIKGVTMEAAFLPSETNGCKDGKAVRWQVQDGETSWFTLAAEIMHSDSGAAEKTCKHLVADWGTALFVAFFQTALAYVSVFFDEREISLLNPWRPPMYVMMALMVPWLIVQELVFPKIRFSISLTKKNITRLGKRKDMSAPISIKFTPQYELASIPKTKLMKILVIEHVLLNVVEHMHFEDVINLSLTSRAVREAVYPPNDLDYRVPKLRKHACNEEEIYFRYPCEYCNKPICNSCRHSEQVPLHTGIRHRDCKPVCKMCYYGTFSRHRQTRAPGQRRHPWGCDCRRKNRKPRAQNMCRTCAAKDIHEVQAASKERFRHQVWNAAFKEGAECKQCKVALVDGPRWWVCGACSGECKSAMHPAYVKSVKVDVEKGVSENEEEKNGKPWWRQLFRSG